MVKKNERICIIGGGPAGLSAAMYLEKKGYTNYEIYEKQNKVGGKCFSPKIKVVGGEERSFETGAIMGAISYHAVHEMEEFGGYLHKGPDFKEGEPNMRREFRNVDGSFDDPFNPKFKGTPRKVLKLLKLKKQYKRAGELMKTKYYGYDCYGHVGVAKGEYLGISKTCAGYSEEFTPETSFPNYIKGTNPNLKDLALPFSEFCKLNKIEEVLRLWLAPYTSFGYGYFDEIPAAYVMKYLDITTATEFFALKLWTWQDGTQGIYTHVNEKLAHPAHLNTEVVKVERPKGEKIKVTLKENGNERVEEFDKLIVTTPLDYFKDYADASETEKELFSKIRHEKYVDFIAKFPEDKSPVISGYFLENMKKENLGHAMVYYNRWQNLGNNCPCTVYALRNHEKMEDIPYDVTINNMMNDMEKAGYKVEERLYEQETYYCPHVSSKDYADGWYDKLEAIQGENNTFFAGEVLTFGDMEDTCASSKDLITRFFNEE